MKPSAEVFSFVGGVILALLCALCLVPARTSGLHQSTATPSRRAFVAGSAASISSLLLKPHEPANADPMDAFVPVGMGGMSRPPFKEVSETSLFFVSPMNLRTKLGSSRIGASGSFYPIQQSLSPFASQELYYAPFLFGAWNVTALLKQKSFPFGKDFIPSVSLIEGSPRNREEKVGDVTSFQLDFFSTLADTAGNTKMTVNLGVGVPQPKIIADRAFNAYSLNGAYNQLAPIEEVDWDYRADPTRLSIKFSTMSGDMRPLGPRRGEVYLTARQSETSEDGSTFCAVERSRSVSVGQGSVTVMDQESITEFQQIDDDTVHATSRIAVYLTPNPNSREGVLWQQVGGKAVAFYDYEWEMKRFKEEKTLSDGSKVFRPCVTTPKDVLQCE
jgi:hypothetical protein